MTKLTNPTPISAFALEGVTGGAAPIVGGDLDGGDPPADPGTNDLIFGTTGDDKLDGGAGSDVVFGNLGNDLVTVRNDGSDTVFGNGGDDTAVVGWRGDGSVFHGGPGNDVLRLTFGDDAIIGGPPSIDSTTPFRIEGNQMIFEGPASGTVTWHGMTVHFTGVEVVQAHGWYPEYE